MEDDRASPLQNVRTASGVDVLDVYHTAYAPKNFMLEIEQRCHKTFEDYRTLGEYFNISFENACAELDKYAIEISNALKAADDKFLDEVNHYYQCDLPTFNELEKNYFGAVETKNCVYAMELDEGTVKIGRTANIEKRVKQIETENNCRVLRVFNTKILPLEAAAQIEAACLETFAAFLAHDSEYFNIDFETARAEIERLVKIESSALSPLDKLETLNRLDKYIELATDLALRDELIKAALKFLIR